MLEGTVRCGSGGLEERLKTSGLRVRKTMLEVVTTSNSWLVGAAKQRLSSFIYFWVRTTPSIHSLLVVLVRVQVVWCGLCPAPFHDENTRVC